MIGVSLADLDFFYFFFVSAKTRNKKYVAYTETRNTKIQPPRAAQDGKVPPWVNLLSGLIWIVKTIRIKNVKIW